MSGAPLPSACFCRSLLYGLVLAVREPEFRDRNLLLFLFAAFYTLLHLLTWAMIRYRLPIDAALMPLAALAVSDLAPRVRAIVLKRTI